MASYYTPSHFLILLAPYKTSAVPVLALRPWNAPPSGISSPEIFPTRKKANPFPYYSKWRPARAQDTNKKVYWYYYNIHRVSAEVTPYNVIRDSQIYSDNIDTYS